MSLFQNGYYFFFQLKPFLTQLPFFITTLTSLLENSRVCYILG